MNNKEMKNEELNLEELDQNEMDKVSGGFAWPKAVPPIGSMDISKERAYVW